MTAELKQSADTGAPASGWKPYPAYKDVDIGFIKHGELYILQINGEK